MKNKRGVFGIQFNWIFVLVAGAIILLFFSTIITRQRGISEVSTSNLLIKNIEAILSGAEVSTGTLNKVNIPKTEIEFSCNRFRIGKVSRQLEVMSIFTPSKIKTNQLITWTIDWSLPYRITNLLYLTSPEIRYVFVGNSPFAKEIFGSIPDEIKKVRYDDFSSIKNTNDDKIRLIYFDNYISEGSNIPLAFENLARDKISALNVKGNEDRGEIEFFDVTNKRFINKKTSYYIRKPSLLGAIFSDDIEIFNCVMKNSFKKLNIVSQVYLEKTDQIKKYYSDIGDACGTYHDQALSIINQIQSASIEFIQSNIISLDSLAKTLESQNKQTQLFSCALIY